MNRRITLIAIVALGLLAVVATVLAREISGEAANFSLGSLAQQAQTPSATQTQTARVDLDAALTGSPAHPTLAGRAEFDVDRDGDWKFEINIWGAEALAGQSVGVTVDGALIGSLAINSSGQSAIEITGGPGQAAPPISEGSAIEVRIGTTTVGSGTFIIDTDNDNLNDNDDNLNDNGDDNLNDNADDNFNDNDGTPVPPPADNGNDNSGYPAPPPGDNSNDNGDDNFNDNGDDNLNDNGDDNLNDNSDDNFNDNGDDNANDNSAPPAPTSAPPGDNNNDNSDDNFNDNGGSDNMNDNDDDHGNDNDDDHGNDNNDDNGNDNDDHGNDNDDHGNDNDDDHGNDND